MGRRNQVAAGLDLQLQFEAIQRMVGDAFAESHPLLVSIRSARTKSRQVAKCACHILLVLKLSKFMCLTKSSRTLVRLTSLGGSGPVPGV